MYSWFREPRGLVRAYNWLLLWARLVPTAPLSRRRKENNIFNAKNKMKQKRAKRPTGLDSFAKKTCILVATTKIIPYYSSMRIPVFGFSRCRSAYNAIIKRFERDS
ncbi:hypothetical protein NPIL_554851 [Nephila pilipes]|uniref:Secreted protein n=1 Tax=Nephila pilipes TaxID=299642 RepID=A0A8X6T9S6_NEPPI|nr:hypothetical protein NPIL_554851 [Nephila pilipes]